MKNTLTLTLAFLLSGLSFAQKTSLPEVSISKLPKTTDEFLALRNDIAKTPEGGAAVFVVAMILYGQDTQLGRECLIIASDKSLLSKSSKGYKGFDFASSGDYLIKQMDNKKYLGNTYIKGTTANFSYALNNPPYVVLTSTNPYSGSANSGTLKVFVQCSGADTDRPITLIRNEQGFWKAKEFSSLMVGVKAPKQKSAGASDGDF